MIAWDKKKKKKKNHMRDNWLWSSTKICESLIINIVVKYIISKIEKWEMRCTSRGHEEWWINRHRKALAVGKMLVNGFIAH